MVRKRKDIRGGIIIIKCLVIFLLILSLSRNMFPFFKSQVTEQKRCCPNETSLKTPEVFKRYYKLNDTQADLVILRKK